MKTLTSKNTIGIISLITASMFLPGCSKERTDPKSTTNNYEQMDDYYSTKKQQEQ